jgi:hypothetical protein
MTPEEPTMTPYRRASLLALAILLAIPASASAQGKPAKPGKPTEAAPTATAERRTTDDSSPWDRIRRNRDRDESVIRDWLRTADREGLPPGLAKRESLPPGLERQLRERGKLPPGLDKKLQPLPGDLTRRLSPLPSGSGRGWLGDRVIEYDTRSGIVERVIRILND